MQYIHIYSEEKVVRLDFELDGNYEVGTTYEDYLNGAWVPLNVCLLYTSDAADD